MIAIKDATKPGYESCNLARIMTREFLNLPFRYQFEIVKHFEDLHKTTHYLSLTDEAMASMVFDSVAKNGAYHSLWNVMSKYCAMPLPENPFF